MKNKIGVFDSGLGGITVLKECVKKNPNYEYIYYSDSKNNPYGEKNPQDIISICDKITEYLINQGCKIIIIACNTASAISSTYLREKYPNIKFIAIEPAVKLAYNNTNNNDLCLIMATPGTLDSEKFKQLYDKYHKNNFYLLPCNGLAHLIETENKEKIIEYLNIHLTKYQNKISSVVLGCTHYPIIKDEIKSILGNITFYDGSIGVANYLQKIIKELDLRSNLETIITWIDSSKDKQKIERIKKIWEDINE